MPHSAMDLMRQVSEGGGRAGRLGGWPGQDQQEVRGGQEGQPDQRS